MSRRERKILSSKIAMYSRQKKISPKKLAILAQIETKRAQQILDGDVDDFEMWLLRKICEMLEL